MVAFVPSSTRRLLAVFATAMCVWLLAAAGTAQASTVMGFTDDWGGNPTLLTKSRGIGATASRLYVCWCSVESTPGQSNWFGVDVTYNAMLANGQKPLLVAVGSPSWAHSGSGAGQYPPDSRYDANWQAFVRAMVQRYPRAMGIEIGNEPNLGVFFGGKADPVRFTQLLKQAYSVVKSVAPAMPVVSGGLAGTRYVDRGGMPDDDFLRAMYKNGAKSAMDAIGDHFYPAGHPLVYGFRTDLDRLRSVRNSQGDSGRPIWVTEFGLSTLPFPGHELVSEAEQGPGLASMWCVFARSPDVPVAMIFRLQDVGGDGMGLYRADGSAKPSATAVRDAVVNGNCPPVYSGVQISASANPVTPGQYVKFTATGGPPSGADYRWDTDGSGGFETGTGGTPVVGRIYRNAGTYNVTVKVSDNLESYFATVKVVVGARQRPVPKLSILPGATVRRGAVVTFSGSGSYAVFASVRNYQWDIQKADGRSHHYSGKTIRFVYPKVGTYRVRLTVTDTMGKKGSLTRTLRVTGKKKSRKPARRRAKR
jgi:hypothetical protein